MHGTIAVCDICDAHPDKVRVMEAVFRDFGGALAFHGPVRTVKCFEDNSKVRDLLHEPGHGAVLVVDGGGSLKKSLVGGNLGKKAVENGWAGVVVFGAVRDTQELIETEVGVKALAAFPVATEKKGAGEIDVAVTIAGVDIRPGMYLYADGDGVVLADERLH